MVLQRGGMCYPRTSLTFLLFKFDPAPMQFPSTISLQDIAVLVRRVGVVL